MSTVILESDSEYRVGKIVCVGRNYAEHISEMHAELEKEPVLFLKPATSILNEETPIILPTYSNEIHHEVEMALLVGKKASKIDQENWRDYIAGAGIAIDLTLRDLQKKAKEKGLPWSVSKGFDGSCPISTFVPLSKIVNPENLRISLKLNGEIRQQSTTAKMIFPLKKLISFISGIFTLEPGDIVLTGTPAGVSPLKSGDKIEAEIEKIGRMNFTVQ